MPFNVSVIIPTYNSPQLTDVLHALSRQNCNEIRMEIIVVGQQNLDDLGESINFRYIHLEQDPTPARNRNVGVQNANGDWICFTDSDCIPHPEWLSEFKESLTPERKIIAGSVDVPDGMSYWGWCDHLLGFGKQVKGLSNATTIEYAATLNFCIRKDLFLSLNGFNETFLTPSAEDREFCWRLRKNSHVIYYVPKATVIHNHNRQSLRSAWNHLLHYGESTATFRQIHQEENSRWWRLGRSLVIVPGLGEILGLFRILFRFLTRLVSPYSKLRFIKFQPGILFLDLAHTMGMIYTLRAYAAKDRNCNPQLE